MNARDQVKMYEIQEGMKDKRLILGRPINKDSARQQRLAARAARIEAGEVIKRGRPAKVDMSALLSAIEI